MDSLLSVFLLFVAAIFALLTYLVVPAINAMTLVLAASVLLVAGVWWHWTQFGIEYRTSTWQLQLRNYASYALVLVVILLSYGFYTLSYSASSLQQIVTNVTASARNATRRTVERSARAASAVQTALFAETVPEPTQSFAAAAAE